MDLSKLQELEATRQSVVGSTKKMYLIGVPFLVAGFIMLIIGATKDMTALLIIGIILLAVGIILAAIATSKRNKVVNEVKANIVQTIIRDVYPDAEYQRDGGIPIGVINEVAFFKKPDRYKTSDYFCGTFDGVPFEMSDYDLKEERRTTDSQGHTTVTYETYAKGRMVIIDFKRDIQDTVKVMETTYLGARNGGLKKVELESVEFNKKFKTYTSSDFVAFYILTPQIQLKMLEFESRFKGSTFFSFYQGKLYVAINDNNETLRISVSKPFDEKMVEAISSQVSIPGAIINEFKINDQKYSDDSGLK